MKGFRVVKMAAEDGPLKHRLYHALPPEAGVSPVEMKRPLRTSCHVTSLLFKLAL